MARQAVRVKVVRLQTQADDFPHHFAKRRFAETFGCEDILQMVVQDGRSRQGVGRQGRRRRIEPGGQPPGRGLALGRRGLCVRPGLSGPLPAPIAARLRAPGRPDALPAVGLAEQPVVAFQQVLAVGLLQVVVSDGARRLPQAALQSRAPLGRIQGFQITFAFKEGLGEGRGRRQLLAQGDGSLFAQHVVGVLAPLDQRKLEALAGLEDRQGAVHGAEGGLTARSVPVEAQGRLGVQAPEHLHLLFGQRGAHGRDGGHAGPMAGDGVHIAFHHHQGRAFARRRRPQDLASLAHAVEHVTLVEDRGLRAVQVLGAGLGIHGPAAEGDEPSAPIGDGKHDPVAEAVIGRAAILRRDQQARLDELGRPGALGDQIVLERGAPARRIADAEPRPFRFRQAASSQIVPRLPAHGAAQLGLEPGAGLFQPFGQALAHPVALGRLGIGRRHGHPGLGGQAFHRLHEGEPLGLLQEGDQVAVLAGREVEELALVVIDEEGRAPLLGEGRQADELPALLAQLHRAPDHVGGAQAGLDLVEKPFVELHP